MSTLIPSVDSFKTIFQIYEDAQNTKYQQKKLEYLWKIHIVYWNALLNVKNTT